MDVAMAAAALRTISEGFAQLAEALEKEGLPWPTEPEAGKPKETSKPGPTKPKDPPAEEPEGDQEEPPVEESSKPKAIELADLQGIAGDMIREGNKPRFLEVLKKFKLKNLSSADPSIYQDLYDELKNDG